LLYRPFEKAGAVALGSQRRPFGEGVTDFDAFLNQLIATGYQGYLVVEQAWGEPQGNWKRDLRAAQEKFQKWDTTDPSR
jgi:sugar phosphate isomerase/epimerase